MIAWVAQQSVHVLYTTSITQAEMLRGVKLLPEGKRRQQLSDAVEGMFCEDFNNRVLPFDNHAAIAFANIVIARRQIGRPISQFDAQIAAIAKVQDSLLATRNETDFDHCGISVLNPWHLG